MTPNPPMHWPSPRLVPKLPQQEIEFPDPPRDAGAPSGSVLSIILPALLTAAVMVGIGQLSGMGNWMLYSLPIMLVSSLASVGSYVAQRRRYRRRVVENEHKYRRFLAGQEERLQNLQREQQHLRLQKDPSPQQCLAQVATLGRHLWSRAPGDPDFLDVRLGLGEQPSTVTVHLPALDDWEPDPLVQEAHALAKAYAAIPDVPVCLRLDDAGIIGLVGSRSAVEEAARALAIQLATHHSPDEVKIGAVFTVDRTGQWDWLRWLPHVWSDSPRRRFLANEKESVHELFTSLDELLNRRQRLAAEARGTTPVSFPFTLVLFLAADSLTNDEPLVQRLQAEGPQLGVVTVIVAESDKSLPRTCRALIRLSEPEAFLLRLEPTMVSQRFVADQAPVELARRLAACIAPIRLRRGASMEIPSSISLLDMLEAQRVEDLDVLHRWHDAESDGRSLAAAIGVVAGGEPLLIDLHERAHGPNGLVAGMVGTGKSELLQTLVASLAINYHPHQLAFVLIDYKGGGMARWFESLPHNLGTITNLQEGGQAVRALTSLRVELTYRQKLFEAAGVAHIDEYQRRYARGAPGASEPLPYVVVIVDEFAEMKTEQPDTAREFVRIARIGRALGFRLILAMQKPAGIVDGQIEANTRFRLCLRVAQVEDSQAMLKRPEAAYLTGTGRAYFQVGANEAFQQFQVAWAGAPYAPDDVSAEDLEVASIALDGKRTSLYRPRQSQSENEVTQLDAVVAYVSRAYEESGGTPMRKLWREPLPDHLTLGDLGVAKEWSGQEWSRDSTWLAPVIGRFDDPEHQDQGPLRVDLGNEGHLAIYGASGYGKTTLIESLVLSLTATHSPDDVNFFLLDFGGRLLSILEPLPHVGAVIVSDESERLERLFRYLLSELERRKELFGRAQVRAHNLAEYRQTTGEPLPAIVTVLDNYAGFIERYPDAEAALVQIAREGKGLGIHLVLTADNSLAIKYRVGDNVAMTIALHLLDPGEYSAVIGRLDGAAPAAVPGRGLLKVSKGAQPLEFQTALPAAGEGDAERSAAIEALVAEMQSAWKGTPARPIRTLPEVLPLAELVAPSGRWSPGTGASDGALTAPFGVTVVDLEPCWVDLRAMRSALITGPSQGGKTTLLQTWLLALAEQFPPDYLEMYLLDSRRLGLAPLKGLPHNKTYACEQPDVDEVMAKVKQKLERRHRMLDEVRRQAEGALDPMELLRRNPPMVVAVEDIFDAFDETISESAKEDLGEMLRLASRVGCHFLVTYNPMHHSEYKRPIKDLREMRSGFMVGYCNDTIFSELRLPRGELGRELPAGEGYLIERSQWRKVKVATPNVGEPTLTAWVERLAQQHDGSR